jgi:predicted lipid-binding transport protein (Tim44 family)
MDLDIIICAVIAALLFARLWAVFGRRNEGDKQRPNPFLAPLAGPLNIGRKTAPAVQTEGQRELLPLLQPFKSAPASLAGRLEQIKERDMKFDEKQFLQDAKKNFTTIVQDFAKGEMARITQLVTAPVLAHFQKALEARREAGQTAETRVASVKEVETTTARLDGNQAFITQENVLRDSRNQIIGGEVGKLEEVSDLWTFTRDVTSADPDWKLAETGA